MKPDHAIAPPAGEIAIEDAIAKFADAFTGVAARAQHAIVERDYKMSVIKRFGTPELSS